ncbi:MAG TPA: radical SAM family heme chaperone HemW [Acidimicrobiales bacterium]|nr:radical SAM family heme chaperone HemW [Acidimicrobiales bacterium]
MSSRPLGIYLHVPFCTRRCDYCAFATWTDKAHLAEGYVETCLAELRRAYEHEGLGPATTVYIGGGTPSLLAPDMLVRLLGAVERAPDAEVTVECNPESTGAPLLEALAGAGVTRISLGVQSMLPHVLEGLGRAHTPGAVERAVALVGATGFPTFNVDLVYGGAGETDADWAGTLERVLALEPSPPHVSAYALTVEPGTPLARDPSRHPDDDVQAERYAVADELLGAAGMGWYEISNWARPGHECRHNLDCWHQADYRGIGCSAHSHLGGRRFWNIRSVERYAAAVALGEQPIAGEERLSGPRRRLEALELALRTREGVPADALDGDDPALAGLAERRGAAWVLTLRGRMLANEVALRLRAGDEAVAMRPGARLP